MGGSTLRTKGIAQISGQRKRTASKLTSTFREVVQASFISLQGEGLIDFPLRTTFSPTHPRARRDVP